MIGDTEDDGVDATLELDTRAQHQAIAAKVSEWSNVAKEALAGNTLKAYKVDGRIYSDYCQAHQLNPIPD